jgi:hypothetical protein
LLPASQYGLKISPLDQELASIVRGAQTLARFIAGFFAAGGLPGEPLGQEAAR